MNVTGPQAHPLVRAAAIVVSAALLCAGTVVAFAAIGDGLFHNSASAQELPLPPLGSTLQEGSTVYASDGQTVLAVLQASVYRKPVYLSQVSKIMVTAVLDTEDHRFYIHGGFDIPSTIRALADDSSNDALQGGSTITQQLVKQLYLTSERTISRKIKEAVLADRLEREYSKNQILQAYLNTIYLGNGAYGVEAAANVYFGEQASQLNLAQSALLAGMISDPTGYDPILQAETSRDRRSAVLDRMVYYGDITQAQANVANAVPLPTTVVHIPTGGNEITDYYVQQVESLLLNEPNSPLGSTYAQRYEALFEGGLRIYTNLNANLQSLAQQSVAAETPANNRGFEQAMVAINPSNGDVEALVGGTGFNQSQVDIPIQGSRQPGSGFKVFTLLAALQQGYSIYDTLDGQSPCAIKFPGDDDLVTHPANNDEGNGGGILTLLNATAQSTNCAYIRLAHEVGLQNVVNMAHSLGISETLPLYPSIVIGAIAVHPIEMAAAYAAVANGGVYYAPSFINHIVDRTGDTIYQESSPGRRVISEQLDAEALVAFQAVVQDGTGTAAALPGRPVGGKTGTTNENVDAWFNGFTPQLEATVWMGNLESEVPMVDVGGVGEVYGGTFPAETWRYFMEQALAGQPVEYFPTMNPGLLPPSEYITSPSLQADDVLDHNSTSKASTSTTTSLPGQSHSGPPPHFGPPPTNTPGPPSGGQ